MSSKNNHTISSTDRGCYVPSKFFIVSINKFNDTNRLKNLSNVLTVIIKYIISILFIIIVYVINILICNF